jgi:hypothetical protein
MKMFIILDMKKNQIDNFSLKIIVLREKLIEELHQPCPRNTGF